MGQTRKRMKSMKSKKGGSSRSFKAFSNRVRSLNPFRKRLQSARSMRIPTMAEPVNTVFNENIRAQSEPIINAYYGNKLQYPEATWAPKQNFPNLPPYPVIKPIPVSPPSPPRSWWQRSRNANYSHSLHLH